MGHAGEIVVQAGERGVPLSIEEGLDSKPHVPTKEEKREKAQRPWVTFESHDYVPNGKLCLRVAHAPHQYRKRKRWRDEDDAA